MLNKIESISPNFIKRLFVKIPFNYRYGSVYSVTQKTIRDSENWSENDLERYIINHFDRIFQFAKKIPFYKNKYERSGVMDLVVTSIEDIKKIPILTRSEIRENYMEFDGYYSDSTGGTSGIPLSIYFDKNAWAREWAHFHHIWGKVGYKYTDAKFTLRQQNLKDKLIKYTFQHNDYKLNTYNLKDHHIRDFYYILTKRNVKYFHGYPSSINDFLKKIEGRITKNQMELLKSKIKCCLYASEYPTPQIVDYLKNNWNLNFISWYGHTEKCVLAASNINELIYYPMHTYGYVEVEKNMLLGTSYHNFDMPLIRYNTDDLVAPKRFFKWNS